MKTRLIRRSTVSRIGFGLLALKVAITMAGAASAAEPALQRANVLFILIDDPAANMTSILNESPVRTPHMERLAARGSRFTRAYAAVPTCAASRTAFLTGVAAHNSGVHWNSQAFRRTQAPISQAVTMQRQFLNHGYLVAGCGKITHTAHQDDNLSDYTPGVF